MADPNINAALRNVLKACIKTTEKRKEEATAQRQANQRDSSQSTPVAINAEVNQQFSLDTKREELMKDITHELERTLKDGLESLPRESRNYLLDHLCENGYDADQKKFVKLLNEDSLETLRDDLVELLPSLEAFEAAWNGDKAKVEKYLKEYPSAKDKTGLWGTTLLYSAARNNRFDVVKYLVDEAKCSIDAQNQQHVKRALSVKIEKEDNVQRNPSAGSTALHGACFNGHLDIVKFLVERGANYFIRNHADETAIMHAEKYPQIVDYFRSMLVLGYSKKATDLPYQPILEDAQDCVFDCMWEYKPFSDQRWFPFSFDEAKNLQQCLLVTPDATFKREIHLKVKNGIYVVSLLEFLRSGRNNDHNQKPAWIRCRGSSIANFKCYALWQIMLSQHSKAKNDPSMKMLRFPTSYDSRFELQLHSWYFVDARVMNELDNAMKNRRKYLRLQIDSVNQGKKLTFNLEDFTFANEDKSIQGFIRWLPKMISNDSKHKDKIIGYDEFETMANSDMVPLTVKRLKELSGTKELKSTDNIAHGEENEDYPDDFDGDDDIADAHVFEDDDDLGGSPSESYGSGAAQISALNDYIDDRDPEEMVIGSTTDSRTSSSMGWAATTSSTSSDGDKPIEDFVNEAAANHRSDEQERLKEIVLPTDESKISGAMKKEISKLKEDNDHLQSELDGQRSKIKQLESDASQAGKYAKELANLKDRVKDMERKQKENENKKEKIQTLLKSIKTIEYTNIHRDLIQKVFTPRSALILKYLRDTCSDIDPLIADRIPQMIFEEKKGNYVITITGVQKQHDQFKAIRQRILSLSNVIQKAKEFYQRKLKQSTKTLIKGMMQEIRPRTSNWIEFTSLFSELFTVKQEEYQRKFEEHIEEKMRELLDRCIMNKLDKPWIEVQNETDLHMKNYSLLEEVDETKQKTLAQFIEKNISSQSHKFETKPSAKSMEVLQNFISRVKKEFRQENQYKGHHLKSFVGIPKLLQRIMLYYSSFKIQLPLYESCEDLLEKIDKNAITTISTSTGSGKSTLLPALLIADGYDKVIVTQPRRLPCQLISKRVNQTMLSEIRSNKEPLAGWAVSGAQQNPQAKVIYLTDGLLKERLLYDKTFITKNTNLNKSVVFFIDEVHERSVNIDLCLAFLARLLTIEPELKSKMKVIISSATLDASVPNLFRKIPQAGLAEFKMPSLGTLHPVVKNHRPNENVLDIVQELCKKRKRHDQILCFVSSVSEVNQSCRLINEISHGTIVAHPLVQSQHPNVQQDFIENGTVFFSTTVAETSLTFPSLKYVIDTGMINIPVYDCELKRTVLKEMRAAESTIKQRLGRLGRTQPGEYYSVYDFKVDDLRFPVPQIRQSDLMNIEFSLRKSPLQNGLDYLKQFLPDPPTPKDIAATNDDLEALGIIKKGSSSQLTSHGQDLAKLPDFGSLAMSKAVLAALRQYNCGLDLIRLSAILGVLNTTVLFKSIPIGLKSADGDFMTLLNVMKAVLSVRQSCSPRQINIDEVCRTKGLLEIRHVIRQALRRYTTLEKTFKRSPEFRQQAHIESNDWSSIARALLAGYYDNVFVSMKKLHSKQLQFIRYNGSGDIAILDLQSTLTRPISEDPVDFVLARDIRHSTAVRGRAVLSFVGELQAAWVEHKITREMTLTAEDENYLNSSNIYKTAESKFSGAVAMTLSKNRVSMRGSAGSVLNAELHLRQEMVHEQQFTLTHLSGGKPHANFQRNLESIMKMPYIFKPMIWRWQAERQVKIEVNPDTANKTCQISVRGKVSDFQDVKKEFDTFIRWLQPCAVIRHPNSGISPRVLRPAMRKTCKDIEERIARVTDPNRTPVDLHHGVKGAKATRETRMEVVAWIAICKFNCKVEGGFVRDWIVGHYVSRPAGGAANPKSWIQYAGKIPGLNKEVVPCDIDCHLSAHDYFSIEKFQDELYKLDISCSVVREDWRYILLLDEDAPTGPFTMDLIEPHVALTHDRIDLDVNNLSVEKDYTHELGMRIDIQSRPYSIELETVVDNIKNKRFQVLRPIDNFIQDRMNKMIQTRGWTHTGQVFSIIPEPHFKQNAILVPLPKGSLYSQIVAEMQTIPSVQIISIEQLRNPLLEETYEGMKKIIKRQCPHDNPNETELFHGTGGDGIKGIVEDGYDDRYFSSGGLYGHGAYFADNPVKSHGYTTIDATDGTRVMFYNKVCLGKSHILTTTNSALVSAPVGFHSVIGKHNNLTEYIVYRYGQALPYLKIVYKG